MQLSSLLPGFTRSVPLSIESYVETRRWLQERASVSGSPFNHHKDQTDKLLACFLEVQMSDSDALAFCRAFIEQPSFWLEWEVYAESGEADSHHTERCGFISNLRAGRPTMMRIHPKS